MPAKPTKPKSLYTIRKWRGDDSYSWAVFRKGAFTPIYAGLSQSSARNTRDQLNREASK